MAKTVREIFKLICVGIIKISSRPPKAGWSRSRRDCDIEIR